MTRKRFIKLLMSQGYDRNRANEAADLPFAYMFIYYSILPLYNQR